MSTMIMLTDIAALNPCWDAARLVARVPAGGVSYTDIAKAVGVSVNDRRWLLTRLASRTKQGRNLLILWAVGCAQDVQHVIPEGNLRDTCQAAIAAAVAYAEDNTPTNAAAALTARDAADAALAARDADYAAALAAARADYAAALDAALAAALAARDAADAALAAARAARADYAAALAARDAALAAARAARDAALAAALAAARAARADYAADAYAADRAESQLQTLASALETL